MAQRAGAPFKPPLESADHLPFLDVVGDVGDELLFVVESLARDALILEELGDCAGFNATPPAMHSHVRPVSWWHAAPDADALLR